MLQAMDGDDLLIFPTRLVQFWVPPGLSAKQHWSLIVSTQFVICKFFADNAPLNAVEHSKQMVSLFELSSTGWRWFYLKTPSELPQASCSVPGVRYKMTEWPVFEEQTDDLIINKQVSAANPPTRNDRRIVLIRKRILTNKSFYPEKV